MFIVRASQCVARRGSIRHCRRHQLALRVWRTQYNTNTADERITHRLCSTTNSKYYLRILILFDPVLSRPIALRDWMNFDENCRTSVSSP